MPSLPTRHLLLFIFTLFALTLAHPQTDTDIADLDATDAPCATACIADHPALSKCTGAETGLALDRCRCASYRITNDPQVSCVQQCPGDEQLLFAQRLPVMCAQTMFLWLDLRDAPRPARENAVAAANDPKDTSLASTTTIDGSGKPSGARPSKPPVVGYMVCLWIVGMTIAFSI